MRRSITGTSAQIALTSDVATTDWYPLSPQSLSNITMGLALRRPEEVFLPKRNLLGARLVKVSKISRSEWRKSMIAADNLGMACLTNLTIILILRSGV
jgi:hypothetical protein